MGFSKIMKKIGCIALAGAVVASTVAVPTTVKKADAAKKYKAYLCFASKNYNGAKDEHTTSTSKLGVFNGKTKKSYSGIKIKDASFKKGKFSITVSVTGKNLKKFKKDKGWNSIFVDTTLPGTSKSKLKVSKAVLKMDGKTVKTIKNPVLTPDPGSSQDYTQVMIVNTWNTYSEKKCSAAKITKMPKKSMSVTITGKLK